jgi:para-nitrobenzyl esterase
MRWLPCVTVALFVAACGGQAPAAYDASAPADAGPDAAEVPPDGGLDGPGADATAPPPCDVPPASGAQVARTTRGLVHGTADGDVTKFLGIPYAASPVGDLRWRAPQPHSCWDSVLETTDYGASCPQWLGANIGDEDCLFLNVWTDHVGVSAEPKPVLFWIHGGADLLGAGNQGLGDLNLYDGSHYAQEHGVVVVSVNYRLGGLGFMAHPALAAENAQGAAGNYGLMDIILALHWVQDNIAAFGGDPSRVTIFGESAGGWNICMLLASPLAAGLFHGAISESGSCDLVPRTDLEQRATKLANDLGCTGTDAEVAACLRAQPPHTFVSSITDMLGTTMDGRSMWSSIPYGPTLDGTVLTEDPLARIAAGHHNRVPLIVGTNADEAALFLTADQLPLTCYAYEQKVRALLGAAGDQALALYPCSSYLLPQYALIDLVTDGGFTCHARRLARAASATDGPPVFRYRYTHGLLYGALAPLRACHAIELPFVFHTWESFAYIAIPSEVDMAEAIETYWSHLAAAGNPNAAAFPYWETYSVARDNHLVIDTTITAGEHWHEAQCDFWDAL